MQEVDVTGAVCPKPALVVRRCLDELDPGEELLVRGDYPPAERNLRRTCHKHGYDVAAGPEEGDEETFTLRIRVPADGPEPEPPA